MDLRKLKTLIDLVSDSNVSELEITEAEGKVRIVKSGAEVAHQAYLPAMQMQMAAMQQQPRLQSSPAKPMHQPSQQVILLNHPWLARFTAPAAQGQRLLLKWAAQ